MSNVMGSSFPMIRLKFLGYFKGGTGFPHDEQGNRNSELPFYKVKDLGQAGSDAVLRETENYISRAAAKGLGAFIFPSGTIVFAKVGAALLLNRFRVLSRPACIDNNMMGFIPKPELCDTAFILFALNLLDFGSLVNPGAVPSLNEEQIASQTLTLPPIPVQQAITDYLDRETEKIDALIAAKERLLGILSEKRRALITRAVTRGLNPDVPLKDSGIPWIGEIPAHWKTRRIAMLFRERDERGEPELPLLEVSINTGVVLREFSEDRIESTAADFNTYKVTRAGDIVFNKMRMWQGAVGVAPQDGLVSPDYTVAAPNEALLPEYSGILFRSDMFSAECARRSHGIAWDRLRLYWDGFRDIVVPLPPLREQRAIVAYIQQETEKIDALRVASERTVALLKERRAAMISAAVTGGIDTSVPNKKVGDYGRVIDQMQ